MNSQVNGAWDQQDEWTDAQQIPVDYSMDILVKIINLTKENNIPFILSTSPVKQQVLGTYSAKPFEVLKQTARQNDITFINTYEEFIKKYNKNELEGFYFNHDPSHLNAKGNLAWSNVQYPVLDAYINSNIQKSNHK